MNLDDVREQLDTMGGGERIPFVAFLLEKGAITEEDAKALLGDSARYVKLVQLVNEYWRGKHGGSP